MGTRMPSRSPSRIRRPPPSPPRMGHADAKWITFADPTSTADTIKQDANVAAASTQFTGSVWLKVASGTLNVRLGVIDEAATPAGTHATAALTTTWQRFSVSHTFAAGATGTAN